MRLHEDLKAWVDKELSPEETTRMSELVAGNRDLQNDADFVKALGSEIKNLAVQPAPVGGDAAIQRVRKPLTWQQKLAPIRWQLEALVGIAAAFALVALLFPVFARAKEAAKKDSAAEKSTYAATAKSATAQSASPMGSGGGQPPMYESLGGEAAKRVRAPDLADSLKGGFSGEDRKVGRDLYNSTRGNTSGITTSEAHQYLRPKLHRSSDLSVEVKAADQARLEAEKSIKVVDGFVLNSNTVSSENETRVVIDARVPEEKFEETLRGIRALGKVTAENTLGEDLTAQVVDSRSNVEVLADEESNLVKRLEKARDEASRSVIRGEIRRVRMQLQSWKAQVKQLEEMTTYSELRLTLLQKSTQGPFGQSQDPKDTWNNASVGLGNIMGALGNMLIVLIVYSPIWLPLALVGWMIHKRLRA